MGFLKSKKGSIISDYFKLLEDVAGFSKDWSHEVALYENHLEITSIQKKKLLLNYDQITDVFYGAEAELKEKSKSVFGRALVGALLFGESGAVLGAISGTGTKTKKEYHFYFIISYTGSDGQAVFLPFEDTRRFKGRKLAAKLKELAHVEKPEQPDVVKL